MGEEERRVRLVRCAPDVVLSICRDLGNHEDGRQLRVIEGPPADARVVDYWADHDEGRLVLCVESASYEPVSPDQVPPDQPVTFQAVYPEEARRCSR